MHALLQQLLRFRLVIHSTGIRRVVILQAEILALANPIWLSDFGRFSYQLFEFHGVPECSTATVSSKRLFAQSVMAAPGEPSYNPRSTMSLPR